MISKDCLTPSPGKCGKWGITHTIERAHLLGGRGYVFCCIVVIPMRCQIKRRKYKLDNFFSLLKVGNLSRHLKERDRNGPRHCVEELVLPNLLIWQRMEWPLLQRKTNASTRRANALAHGWVIPHLPQHYRRRVRQSLDNHQKDYPLRFIKLPPIQKYLTGKCLKNGIFMKLTSKIPGAKRLLICPLQFARLKYSVPVNQSVTLDTLKEHLYTLPSTPTDPYRTFLLQGGLGFCLSYNQFQRLTEDVYDVIWLLAEKKGTSPMLNTTFAGDIPDEGVDFQRICHPSMWQRLIFPEYV